MTADPSKILFVAALHGDEGFAVDVLRKLEGDPAFAGQADWMIGNPKAHEQNERYLDGDLNRIAPGDKDGNLYEERRAAELVELSGNYRALIDIHGTDARSGIFVLIPNPTLENLLLAASLPVRNVVIWNSKKSLIRGPFVQYARCPAVEIECGPKHDPETSRDLEKLIREIVARPAPDLAALLENLGRQEHYEVYGKREGVDTDSLREFEETTVDGETFYPLLINSYDRGSVRTMRKLDLPKLLAY